MPDAITAPRRALCGVPASRAHGPITERGTALPRWLARLLVLAGLAAAFWLLGALLHTSSAHAQTVTPTVPAAATAGTRTALPAARTALPAPGTVLQSAAKVDAATAGQAAAAASGVSRHAVRTSRTATAAVSRVAAAVTSTAGEDALGTAVQALDTRIAQPVVRTVDVTLEAVPDVVASADRVVTSTTHDALHPQRPAAASTASPAGAQAGVRTARQRRAPAPEGSRTYPAAGRVFGPASPSATASPVPERRTGAADRTPAPYPVAPAPQGPLQEPFGAAATSAGGHDQAAATTERRCFAVPDVREDALDSEPASTPAQVHERTFSPD